MTWSEIPVILVDDFTSDWFVVEIKSSRIFSLDGLSLIQ
jgi:hypothetical protein